MIVFETLIHQKDFNYFHEIVRMVSFRSLPKMIYFVEITSTFPLQICKHKNLLFHGNQTYQAMKFSRTYA